MRVKVKLSSKGQILIPKVVRESVGLKENKSAMLEVKDDSVVIRPLSEGDLVARAGQRARMHGGDVSKWVLGDKLYEEVFG